MKTFFLFSLLIISTTTFSQPVSNACKFFFDSNQTAIHYSYNDASQTHDYSNNWDFDGDGKTDSLYFVGTGGAHLYYFLRIILSSDNKTRDFSFLGLDMPCLGNIKELKDPKFSLLPQFVVDKFIQHSKTDNTKDKIYLHIDSYSTIPERWKKRGVSSDKLLLQYKNGEMIIKNYNL